nr:hypothetical protein [Tanacetum cinerariifolium]
MLLLALHESSEPTKEPVYNSVTPSSLPQHDLSTPCKSHLNDINLSFILQQETTSKVIDDVIRQLTFEETKLNGEAGFADVAWSGVESFGLSHNESLKV